MSDHVYKKIELVGSSPNSTDDAIRSAIEKASRTLRHVDWFQVIEHRGHVVDGKVAQTRGHIEDGKISHWQVTVKIGFTLDDGA